MVYIERKKKLKRIGLLVIIFSLIQYSHPCHLVQKGLFNANITMHKFNNSQIQTLFVFIVSIT